MTSIARRLAILSWVLPSLLGGLADPAVAWSWTRAAVVAVSVVGEDSRPPNANPKAQPKTADELLLRAQQSIAEGQFQQAEALIERAEALKVRYPFFFTGRTPAKMRRELKKARSRSTAPRLPSQRFQPLPDAAGAEQGTTADPFLSRHARGPNQNPGSPLAIQTSDELADRIGLPNAPIGALPGQSPFGAAATTRPPGFNSAPPAGAAEPGRVASALTNPLSSAVAGDNKLEQAKKQQVLEQLRQARAALAQGDIDAADRLVSEATAADVPNHLFRPGEDRPWIVALLVRSARRQGRRVAVGEPKPAAMASRAGQAVPASASAVKAVRTAPDLLLALPREGRDAAPTRRPAAKPGNATASAQATIPLPTGTAVARTAATEASPPNPAEQATPPGPGEPSGLAKPGPAGSPSEPPGLIDRAETDQRLLERKVAAEVIERLAKARGMVERNAKDAIELLQETRTLVADSELLSEPRSRLLRRVDLGLRKTEQYIQDHRAEIELDQRNREVLKDIDRRRLAKQEISERLAQLVDQFNELRDQQRFAEMEVVAKRARELAPDHPLAKQMWENARFIVRNMRNLALGDRKEGAVVNTLFAVEESSVPFDDNDPYRHGNVKEWNELSEKRLQRYKENNRHFSAREQEIRRKLKSPVLLQFTNTPLAEVMNHLMKLTGVNIHLDERGMAEEGVASDTPVTINLDEEISLESALNLILEELHLSYVIKDEVLKITSEQTRDGDIKTRTYDVADLVIPIPNFVPGANQGLQGALSHAQAALGHGPTGYGFGPPMAVLASHDGTEASGMTNPNMLAQMSGGMASPNSPTIPIGSGPGGLGGGVEPDFDSLIELITATIAPETWDETGGPGSIAPFEINLSLVISQTQEIHEQIADLLDQLRRLQDLQVTIEVRFITLSDSFFERIGIDFDFNIEDGSSLDSTDLLDQDRVSPSITLGRDVGGTFPAFTADLDIPFRQESFLGATPAFGGFDPVSAGTFGFAILSDIEAFFLIEAAQGDSRSNVLQAPKVTLFNGQLAYVQDTSQQPFVISVIPVVGDFAAAQQPVIVVLSEGTSMSVQAVVSPDRRYVRLTVVPFFSKIGKVDTFTFEGSTTTTKGSSSTVDPNNDSILSQDDNSNVIRQGTTVQLPTFAFVTVTTTVSVPDGGTVLLGGIKRLSEGRSELGVPLLSKIPYVDRLFRNVGIGRDTSSLMMMVTPRIIIQEEEEEMLLGAPAE